MKKQVRSLWFLSVLALFLSVGIGLSAQQTNPPAAQPPDAQAQQPANPDQTQPPTTTAPAPPAASETQGQAPPASDSEKSATGTTNDAGQATGVQSFAGTIVKSGSKYVLQDESGKTYDVDHQDEVQKFEGKKVKVHGTLDASAKMIHVQ